MYDSSMSVIVYSVGNEPLRRFNLDKNVLSSVYNCMHEGREKTNLHMRQNNDDWLFIVLEQVTTFENN